MGHCSATPDEEHAFTHASNRLNKTIFPVFFLELLGLIGTSVGVWRHAGVFTPATVILSNKGYDSRASKPDYTVLSAI